jgi:HSP20 family molecular chaperone IbpA
MKESKKRYSVPARILELLFTDDAFFNEVTKLKKASSSSKFPRSDEWKDGEGFHISFALAGYAPDDVSIESIENTLVIKGRGMDSLGNKNNSMPPEKEADAFESYTKESRPRIHQGIISRGIARRKFCVKHLISEEFDASSAVAEMKHGLLHIFVPEKENIDRRDIQIKYGREE